MSSNKTISPSDLDIRVRDRNLKSGALSEKDLEQFLSALPDLADASEPVTLAQPALAGDDAEAEDDDELDASEEPS